MADRHPGDHLLLELALSDVDEQQRDALTRHLALCEPCRAAYSALADSVDHVLAAAPRVAPPPGFSRSVLTAIGIAPTASSSPVGPARRERRRRRGWTPVAAAAALGLLVGAAGAVVVLDARAPGAGVVAAVGPALVTPDGARVGTVLDSRFGGDPVLVVTLTDGRVGAGYACTLVLADGSREVVGRWVLQDPAGATWVVARPDSGPAITSIELVTDAGATWAAASL